MAMRQVGMGWDRATRWDGMGWDGMGWDVGVRQGGKKNIGGGTGDETRRKGGGGRILWEVG